MTASIPIAYNGPFITAVHRMRARARCVIRHIVFSIVRVHRNPPSVDGIRISLPLDRSSTFLEAS